MHEVGRFEDAYGLCLGIVVTIDGQAGTVTAQGEGLTKWGPRQCLSAALDRAGLRHDVYAQSATIVVYPSSG